MRAGIEIFNNSSQIYDSQADKLKVDLKFESIIFNAQTHIFLQEQLSWNNKTPNAAWIYTKTKVFSVSSSIIGNGNHKSLVCV